MLSPTIEVLILLEHKGEVSAVELRKWRKTSLKGIIGKLEAQSLIKRTKKGKEVFYSLSNDGLEYLDKYLEYLHDSKEPSNRWTVVLFGIPETNRSSRDKLRRFLQKNGFGNMFGSAWISNAKPGLADKVMAHARELNIFDRVVVIDGHGTPNDNRKISSIAWDVKKVAREYTQFITKSKSKLKTLKKGSSDSAYEAKKLIFELATIVESDPCLPSNLLPANWPKAQAIDQYKKIREKIS